VKLVSKPVIGISTFLLNGYTFVEETRSVKITAKRRKLIKRSAEVSEIEAQAA